jgi:hypothetical protein
MPAKRGRKAAEEELLQKSPDDPHVKDFPDIKKWIEKERRRRSRENR